MAARETLAAAPRPPHGAATAGRGDEAELFRRHHRALVAQVERRLAVPRELAEDACQVAWLQLLRCQPDRERVVGWLYTVAKHELFAARRRQRAQTPDDQLDSHADPAGGDPLDAMEARELLRLLPQLRAQQRLVLWLQLEGYSYQQICQLTGKTYTWANRHITEGRRALRELAATGAPTGAGGEA